MTLYYYTGDGNNNTSTVTGGLLQKFPAFYAADIVAVSSLKLSEFGTITSYDGQKQNTFRGWPLYYYSGDLKSGDTLGQGTSGMWFVIVPEKFAIVPTVPTGGSGGGGY